MIKSESRSQRVTFSHDLYEVRSQCGQKEALWDGCVQRRNGIEMTRIPKLGVDYKKGDGWAEQR